MIASCFRRHDAGNAVGFGGSSLVGFSGREAILRNTLLLACLSQMLHANAVLSHHQGKVVIDLARSSSNGRKGLNLKRAFSPASFLRVKIRKEGRNRPRRQAGHTLLLPARANHLPHTSPSFPPSPSSPISPPPFSPPSSALYLAATRCRSCSSVNVSRRG